MDLATVASLVVLMGGCFCKRQKKRPVVLDICAIREQNTQSFGEYCREV